MYINHRLCHTDLRLAEHSTKKTVMSMTLDGYVCSPLREHQLKKTGVFVTKIKMTHIFCAVITVKKKQLQLSPITDSAEAFRGT